MDIPGELVTLVGACFAALVGVIGTLWRVIAKRHIGTEKKLERCEQGHRETGKRMIQMSSQIGHLEGRFEGVESMSAAVIKEVRSAIKETDLDPSP